MLQPQKKKLNPAQKSRAITPKTKSKAPASYDVDWDAVRSVNDNVAVQAAKIFDPTGLSSWPDVYYAIDDYNKGKGSGLNIALNVLGALPVLGKLGKGAGILGKSEKLAKAASKVSKVEKVVDKAEKIVPRIAKAVGKTGETIATVSRGGKANPIGVAAKAVGKVAKGVDKLDTATRVVTSKVLQKIPGTAGDAGNIVNAISSALNITNTASDVKSVVEASNKNKTIKYYNTNSKHGEIETPGNEKDVQYVPISNSAELAKWKQQKLAFGTNSQGIMKTKMNPRKKYANGTTATGMNPSNYIISPAQALNDYNIMMAKTENAAVNNPWAPYVTAIGGAVSNFLGSSSKMLTKESGEDDDEDADTSEKKAMGTNNIQSDVEVEGGEMYETPQGQVGEFEGPSHEQGGIPLEVGEDVEEGTKVYSDRLKVGDKTLAERKETREKRIANLEKIASQPLIDQAIKNASKRKMMAIEKEEAGDLAFQEQVNNMQQMADTMVAAFGTSMAGLQDNPVGDSMRYGYGSGSEGVMKYPFGTPLFGVKKNPYADPLNYDTNAIKNLHDALGITPAIAGKSYGKDVGPKTLKAYQDFVIPYMEKQGYSNLTTKNFPNISRFYKDGKVTFNQGEAQALGLTTEGSKYIGPESNFYGDMADDVQGALPKTNFSTETLASKAFETEDPFAMTAGEDWAKANPLPQGAEAPISDNIGFTPQYAISDTTAKKTTEEKESNSFMKALAGSLPALGDMTKLFGNYKGMKAGIDTANQQRASDVTKTNVYRNAGEESQRLLDNAKQGIETSKAQAIVKANANTRTGRKGARNSARGVNQMRGMDWLYDTALNQQIAEITANTAEKMSGIDIQKSGVAMNADQLKGQGDWQATMANSADKDAYYTALALGRKDFATGLQQSGKDLNDMKTNKILEKLLSQSGEYAGMTAKGDIFGKPAKVSKDTNSNKIQIINGIKYEEDASGNLIKVTV